MKLITILFTFFSASFLLVVLFPPIYLAIKWIKNLVVLLIFTFVWSIYARNPVIAISLTLVFFSFLQLILSDSFLTNYDMYHGINKCEKEKIHRKIFLDKANLTNMTILFTIFNLFCPKYYCFLRKTALKHVNPELKALFPFLSQHVQLKISIYYQYIAILLIIIFASYILLILEKKLVPHIKQYYIKAIRKEVLAMDKKLKINTWTAVFNIINCVLFSIFFIKFGATSEATSGTSIFFYVMAGIGVILNIICIYQSHRHGIKKTGGILGTIANAYFGLTALLTFPAIVLLIISCVFLFQQHVAKNTDNTSAQH